MFCAVSIIGIPFAWQHVKLAALALCPIGKTIVAALPMVRVDMVEKIFYCSATKCLPR